MRAFLTMTIFLFPASCLFAGESNAVVIEMSDESVFKGTFEDRDGNLIMMKGEDGDDISLPVEEMKSINGQEPSAFLKTFVPTISDSLFSPFELASKNEKAKINFKFLSAWMKSNAPDGFIFLAPEEDRRWEGFRFTVTLESPPSIPGAPEYEALLKKLSDGGTQVLSQTYDMTMGTRTLRTTEAAKGNFMNRSLRQIRFLNGAPCLLELVLSHSVKERLNQPSAVSLFDKTAKSVRFPGEPKAQVKAPVRAQTKARRKGRKR